MKGTRGVVLMIWGSRAYGYAAHNFAMSIKSLSPSLPIHLITDREAAKGCGDLGLFSAVEYLNSTPNDPAFAKMQIYSRLPFEYNLYLDVDAICVHPLDAIFEQLIEDDRPYRCAVHAWYDKDSPEKFPLMVWANKSTIWNHYGFTDQRLPATQSSIQFIQKSEFSDNLFKQIQSNYANRIPLEKLESKWGGGQPDELYLNVTLAQLGYDPTLTGAIYFGDDRTLSFSKIPEPILSMFGTAQNIKSQFIRGYDASLSKMGREMGVKPIEWKHIAGKKIANSTASPKMANNGLGRGAFEKRFFKEMPPPSQPVKGVVNMFITNLYETINDARRSELMECIRINCLSPSITKIYNYGNLPYDDPKVVNIPITKRATYQFIIDEANRIGGDYTIISNSDLYVDHTINWIDKIDLHKRMLALCRYNVKKNHADLEAYAWSQGTWIFKGKIELTGCDYVIGIPGCENALAFDADKHGYHVANPAKDIKMYHLHESNFRTYTENDRIKRDYLPVLISSINDLISTKRALIVQPGAVGDILIVLPIAKWYADRGYTIEWECPERFHSMFDYVNYATPVVARKGNYNLVIDLSFGIDQTTLAHRMWMREKPTLDSFVTLKYRISGVPISELRNLQYNRNEKNEKFLFDLLSLSESTDYILVHGSSTYGDPITVDSELLQIPFSPMEGFSIFDWRKVIECAKEIHCIDSSLVNFVDKIETSASLYYYPTNKVPMQADRTLLTKKWEVREYAIS